MRTRRGECYSKAVNMCIDTNTVSTRRKSPVTAADDVNYRKKSKISPDMAGESTISGGFDCLPDDLVICILRKLSASANRPADFINVLITCKRLNELGLHSLVLSKASHRTLAIKAENWSDSAHKFLKLCAGTGNVEACYILGMIRFYCLQNRGTGASLMAKAAIGNHAPALYSLAVVQFNGSGGSKNDKDLRAGVALCARAAFLGHVDALRELGHCLQDGYGVKRNVSEGRRLLIQANARELAHVLVTRPATWLDWDPQRHVPGACTFLSDFGCNLPDPDVHPANRFLFDWYSGRVGSKLDPGLRLCSHLGCGRPESRVHEFRRCSVCGAVNYCSRACQALDWKVRHKAECAPVERWVYGENGVDGDVNGNGNGENGGVVFDDYELMDGGS